MARKRRIAAAGHSGQYKHILVRGVFVSCFRYNTLRESVRVWASKSSNSYTIIYTVNWYYAQKKQKIKNKNRRVRYYSNDVGTLCNRTTA